MSALTAWEVCRSTNGNFDICLPEKPGVGGAAVVATVFGGESAANLIGAAPDLLEALLLIVEGTHLRPKERGVVENALAKARGETK